MDKWQLKIHGDDLEKKYSEEIISKVYAYDLIWSNFIGNNGLNQLVSLRNFPVQKNDYRKRFSEHHYTIIQSIICLRLIKEDIILFNASQSDAVLRIQNHILSFYGHMGRIFDNLLQLVYYYGRIADKITKELDLDEMVHDNRFVRPMVKEIEEFYYQRHIVLHGKQVPIGSDKIGNIIFPILKTEKNNPAGYDKTMTWSEVGEMTLLTDSITEIETNLPSCVNSILHVMFNDLKKYLNEHNIVIEPPSSILNKKTSLGVAIDVYNFQGKNLRQLNEGRSGYSGSVSSKDSMKD